MARRRRKTLRVMTRTLPKVFSCPKCGAAGIRITSHQDDVSHDVVMTIACGNCALRRELRYSTPKAEIDVYNTFVDDFVKTSG